ncbi:hypothetical protein RQP53_17895 [Paucibacter sp. APW11]|uniref:Tn3 transposase DDE domain-containing protein n=1 Tax=Roseateles aquae TaxID=3077235 RepID=A0ABU3PEX3_9BURK|nr:hypothetical protein [Paucibacter sp. APW11]MDT9001155.1 hypothetical protein [Paucibacter sp. APW11]
MANYQSVVFEHQGLLDIKATSLLLDRIANVLNWRTVFQTFSALAGRAAGLPLQAPICGAVAELSTPAFEVSV